MLGLFKPTFPLQVSQWISIDEWPHMYMCIKIQDIHSSEEERDPGSSSGISEQREFYMYLHRQW